MYKWFFLRATPDLGLRCTIWCTLAQPPSRSSFLNAATPHAPDRQELPLNRCPTILWSSTWCRNISLPPPRRFIPTIKTAVHTPIQQPPEAVPLITKEDAAAPQNLQRRPRHTRRRRGKLSWTGVPELFRNSSVVFFSFVTPTLKATIDDREVVELKKSTPWADQPRAHVSLHDVTVVACRVRSSGMP